MFFSLFSLHVWSQRGWTEVEETKGGKEFIREHISLTANTDHPYRISILLVYQVTKGYCRSKYLQNHYRPKPFPCVGAVALFGVAVMIMTPLTGLFLMNLSNVKLATIRQKVT